MHVQFPLFLQEENQPWGLNWSIEINWAMGSVLRNLSVPLRDLTLHLITHACTCIHASVIKSTFKILNDHQKKYWNNLGTLWTLNSIPLQIIYIYSYGTDLMSWPLFFFIWLPPHLLNWRKDAYLTMRLLMFCFSLNLHVSLCLPHFPQFRIVPSAVHTF